jgi:hypothetical protein
MDTRQFVWCFDGYLTFFGHPSWCRIGWGLRVRIEANLLIYLTFCDKNIKAESSIPQQCLNSDSYVPKIAPQTPDPQPNLPNLTNPRKDENYEQS